MPTGNVFMIESHSSPVGSSLSLVYADVPAEKSLAKNVTSITLLLATLV